MQLSFRRPLAAAAAASASVRLHQSLSASARLRRHGFSTAAAWPPPWAMIHNATLVKSPAPHSCLLLAAPPSPSHILVPVHHVNPLLLRERDDHPAGDTVAVLGGMVRATSGDGLLLLQFLDGTAAAGPAIAKARAARSRSGGDGDESFYHVYNMEPDITRFVCNPLSGELFRLPDIDGTKKVPTWHAHGILTRSARGNAPPDRYAVAELTVNHDDDAEEEHSFVMRRFLSETGEWEKLVGLPSPLPLPRRRMDIDHEVVPFAGRLYWVDLTWGAVSADPFSDRPELRFVELPSGSVWPVPSTDRIAAHSFHRRIGVSEGRMRYLEMSKKDPFLLKSFVLDDAGSGWTLEHELVFSRVWDVPGAKEVMPRIGVVDPLNAHIASLIIGNHSLLVDMTSGDVLGKSLIGDVAAGGPNSFDFSSFLKPCVLPPWLRSSRIPSTGF